MLPDGFSLVLGYWLQAFLKYEQLVLKSPSASERLDPAAEGIKVPYFWRGAGRNLVKAGALNYVQVELTPLWQRSKTRTRKSAHWMKVDSSYVDYDKIQQVKQKCPLIVDYSIQGRHQRVDSGWNRFFQSRTWGIWTNGDQQRTGLL